MLRGYMSLHTITVTGAQMSTLRCNVQYISPPFGLIICFPKRKKQLYECHTCKPCSTLTVTVSVYVVPDVIV